MLWFLSHCILFVSLRAPIIETRRDPDRITTPLTSTQNMAASSSGTSVTTCQSKRRHTPHDIFSFKYIERAFLLRSISRAHGGLTFRAKCIGLDQFETNPLVPGTITHYCCICLNDKACISHTTAQVNITCLFTVPIQTRKRRKTLCCIV